MRSLKTHLKNRTGYVLLALLFLNACAEEQKSDEIIVKVKESALTRTMLDSATAAYKNKSKVRAELINDWIETEVLFQVAKKEGILEDSEYNSLVNESKKKLAGTMYLRKLVEESDLTPSEYEVEKYFNDFKEDFRLKEELVKLNFLKTSSYEKAVIARNKIVESGWSLTKDYFRVDSALVFSSDYYFKSEIPSSLLNRVLNSLEINEASVVLEYEPNMFSVVLIQEKYGANSIPPFVVVKERAGKLLLALKQKEFIKEHIKKLVEDQNLEIERYSE